MITCLCISNINLAHPSNYPQWCLPPPNWPIAPQVSPPSNWKLWYRKKKHTINCCRRKHILINMTEIMHFEPLWCNSISFKFVNCVMFTPPSPPATGLWWSRVRYHSVFTSVHYLITLVHACLEGFVWMWHKTIVHPSIHSEFSALIQYIFLPMTYFTLAI